MSHELTTRSNGVVEMGYLAGTARWHGLGNELNEDASIDQWIIAAGMDWKVNRSRVRYGEGDQQRIYDEQHVLFRSDTKAPLGIVSPGFKIVQPKTVLEFFRDLCETNDFKLRTAGTLFGGKRFWALADIGEESYVLHKADRVKGRLLLVTACDGSMKTTAKFVSECVVCNNTLTMARAEDGKQIAVSHRSVFNPSDAKMKLGLADGQFAQFMSDARGLAEHRVSLLDSQGMTLRLIGGTDLTTKQREEVEASRGYQKIMGLFSGAGIASDIAGRRNTAWGWLNAVTEYADHHVSARSVDNRFNSSQFGQGERMKNDALQIALAA